jgi:O-antigen/teichoic acid export membrane protein
MILTGLSLWGPYLFKIPSDLQVQFTLLLGGLAVLTAAGFVTRIFTQVLHAHQRNDLSNYVQILGLLVNLVVLWLALEFRAGVFSLLVASAAAWVASICAAVPCQRLGFWPRRGEWGRPNWRSFREMFSFGADLFWIAVGTQLINSSQIIIASQTLGIEAAALWAVMTKPFLLVAQLAWRPIAMSLSAFAEMHARGETARFWDRYWLLFTTANVGAGFLAVVFAFANGPFVALWTGGKMHWSPANDWLLGLWLILLTQLCCHNSMFIVQKQVARLKYVYFAEAAAFVVASMAVTGWGGFPAMIGCSIVCTGLFTLAYGTRRIGPWLHDSQASWLWQSQKPLLRLLSFLVPLALVLRFIFQNTPPLVQLTAGGIPLVLLGGIFLLRSCLPRPLTMKLLEFVPPGFRRLFIRLAAVPLGAE